MQLIPFDEVSRRLALSRRSYLGPREIPIDRIVGSVDRSADFRRDFRPRRRLSRSRLANLRAAFPDGVMPAISVFEVGGAYFVEDGHHRVALAQERGADYIDAEVTRLETSYEIGPDTDVARLVHTEQQRTLLDESGLSRARPDAVIEFTFVDGYTSSRRSSRRTATTSPGGPARCRRPSRWARIGTTRCIAPASTPFAGPGCSSSTPPGIPQTPISFYGSTSAVATCARTTRPSTSTRPRRTRAEWIKTARGVRSGAKVADPYRDGQRRNQGADRMCIVIVGAGPNVGSAIARRFGRAKGCP